MTDGGENSEVAIINHLLQVEKEAGELIDGAQKEADKRTAEYKARAEEEFRKAHDKAEGEMQASYTEQIEAIKKAHEEAVAAYKQSIMDVAQNRGAFNDTVASLLEAGA